MIDWARPTMMAGVQSPTDRAFCWFVVLKFAPMRITLLVFTCVMWMPISLAEQPCAIVKRHVHKFGENMSRVHAHRPFDFVEGNYPEGYKWRSELGDSDVREIQKKGGKVIIMRPDYELADLEDARKQCAAPANPQAPTVPSPN